MASEKERQTLLQNNIRPAETISLAKLDQWLNDLDSRAPKELRLKDVSFQMSYNQSLGLSKDPRDFTKNIIDVLAYGSSGTNTPFVDFASLVPTRDFFLDSPNPNQFPGSVADAIIQFKKGCDKTSTAPVIRFLVGADGSKTRADVWESGNSTLFTDIFWNKTTDGQYEPRVSHPNATIYVGYYNPDFQPKSDENLDLAALMGGLKDIVAKAVPFGNEMLKSFKPADYAKDLVDQGLRTISWNHGKIVAVNGRVMMTGGGNLWDEYKPEQWMPADRLKAGEETYRIDHDIVDHQAKVVGDAAVSAHRWADYFWNYLSSPTKTDSTSCWWKANLSETPNWTSNKMPSEGKKSPFKYSTDSTKGKIPVLTVGKLGDWHGPTNKIDYPTLIIDLGRDLRTWVPALGAEQGSQRRRPDWDDQTAVERIRYRIRRIMLGLPREAGGIDAAKIDGALDKYLHFRRVMKDDGHFYSHSKIVCVDKKLMYVGSDNAYPCYKEEHGIWVEDRATVDAWIKDFFTPYWGKCSPLQGEVEYFKDRIAKKDDQVLSGSAY